MGRTCGCGVHAGGLSIASQRVAVAAARGGVSETRQLAPGEREGCGWHPVLPLQRCSAQRGTYSGRRVIVCVGGSGWVCLWLGVAVRCAFSWTWDVGRQAWGVAKLVAKRGDETPTALVVEAIRLLGKTTVAWWGACIPRD